MKKFCGRQHAASAERLKKSWRIPQKHAESMVPVDARGLQAICGTTKQAGDATVFNGKRKGSGMVSNAKWAFFGVLLGAALMFAGVKFWLKKEARASSFEQKMVYVRGSKSFCMTGDEKRYAWPPVKQTPLFSPVSRGNPIDELNAMASEKWDLPEPLDEALPALLSDGWKIKKTHFTSNAAIPIGYIILERVKP
jgi:hypothetical protein